MEPTRGLRGSCGTGHVYCDRESDSCKIGIDRPPPPITRLRWKLYFPDCRSGLCPSGSASAIPALAAQCMHIHNCLAFSVRSSNNPNMYCTKLSPGVEMPAPSSPESEHSPQSAPSDYSPSSARSASHRYRCRWSGSTSHECLGRYDMFMLGPSS